MKSMPRFPHRCLLALAGVVATGCTHFANVTEVPTADGTPTYVSSRTWDDGTPRVLITERVFSGEDSCEIVQVQREFFDATGALEQRVTDIDTCWVWTSHVVEDFDIRGGRITRTIQEDTDRDGSFDVELVRSEPIGDDPMESPDAERRVRST